VEKIYKISDVDVNRILKARKIFEQNCNKCNSYNNFLLFQNLIVETYQVEEDKDFKIVEINLITKEAKAISKYLLNTAPIKLENKVNNN